MKQFGAFEAKNRLSELLALVEGGEEVVITRHGRAVARLVPAEGATSHAAKEAIEELGRLRAGQTLGGIDLRKLIEEGRRY
ncbi:MAG: type II toxin-antitoxin system prevent-host-death family antitoxin [Burkholderiales bacterium]|nr:type II toxin-antitoxin system prevent-host-death family antitoxin [Burkholderiales bacterium]